MAKKKALPAAFAKFAPAGAMPMLPGRLMGGKAMPAKPAPKKKGGK